jgi:hypothetical protein
MMNEMMSTMGGTGWGMTLDAFSCFFLIVVGTRSLGVRIYLDEAGVNALLVKHYPRRKRIYQRGEK